MPGRAVARSQRGIALIMVLIFVVLLYVLVAELVVTARLARLSGENEALLARMQNHMTYTLSQVEEQLVDDLMASAAGSGAGLGAAPGMGDLGNALPGMAPGGESGLPGEGEGEGAGEGASAADSSQDSWYEPTGYADDDLTTYVWVEDENRKFNILTLLSPDREFAEASRERLVRLIDAMREGTEFDLSSTHGHDLARYIVEWMEGRGRTEAMPRPPLKSDQELGVEQTPMLHLDDLLLLREVTEDIFYNKVLDGRLIPGLESVLTVYTSQVMDPGVPGQNPAGPDGNADPAAAAPPVPEPVDPNAPPEQPIGLGVRININTASRPVLRSLFSTHEVPDSVIEAILRYRNEEVEDTGDGGYGDEATYADFDLGATVRRKIFEEVADLEQLPEFENLGNPEIKQQFMDLVTTKSDVFSVHMASMFKRNEERRVFVLRRSRSVLMRIESGEDVVLHPLILMEERKNALRVSPVDFPDEWSELDYFSELDDMDQFAREERRWNPFFLEFYDKRLHEQAAMR